MVTALVNYSKRIAAGLQVCGWPTHDRSVEKPFLKSLYQSLYVQRSGKARPAPTMILRNQSRPAGINLGSPPQPRLTARESVRLSAIEGSNRLESVARCHAQKTLATKGKTLDLKAQNSKPPVGLEPTTCGLQNRCSTN